MKKALFIYNPSSGNRLVPRELDKILERFQNNGVRITIYRLSERNEELADIMKDESLDFIVAAGGDGTLSNIANIIIKEKIDKPYGTLGTGTCNNFTHNIEIPEDITHAIDTICRMNTTKVDVGIVDEHNIFLSSFAMGMFIEASFKTDTSLKNKLGPFAYYLQALSELANLKSYDITVQTRDEMIHEKAYLMVILNGTHVGGFKNVFSESQIDISDGIMELLIVKEGNPIEIANLFLMLMRNENYLDSDKVILLKSDYFKISSSDTVNVSLDGEKGPALPLEINVSKKALKIIIPQEHKY